LPNLSARRHPEEAPTGRAGQRFVAAALPFLTPRHDELVAAQVLHLQVDDPLDLGERQFRAEYERDRCSAKTATRLWPDPAGQRARLAQQKALPRLAQFELLTWRRIRLLAPRRKVASGLHRVEQDTSTSRKRSVGVLLSGLLDGRSHATDVRMALEPQTTQACHELWPDFGMIQLSERLLEVCPP
jgi:hypothetical protein